MAALLSGARGRVKEARSNTHYSTANDRNRARRASLWAVLRPLQLKLVDAYLASGKSTEALREFTLSAQGDRSALAQCKYEDELCRARLKRFDAAFPGFCLGFEGQSCGLHGTRDFEISAVNDRRKIGRVIDTTVTGVKRVGSELVLTTAQIEPHEWKQCQGRYETDKIKEVRADSVVIERTTWCREIVQRYDKGMSVQYRVPAPDFELPLGAQVRLYVSQQDQRTVGTVTTFSNARLVGVRKSLKSPTIFAGNEELDFEQASLMGLTPTRWDSR